MQQPAKVVSVNETIANLQDMLTATTNQRNASQNECAALAADLIAARRMIKLLEQQLATTAQQT